MCCTVTDASAGEIGHFPALLFISHSLRGQEEGGGGEEGGSLCHGQFRPFPLYARVRRLRYLSTSKQSADVQDYYYLRLCMVSWLFITLESNYLHINKLLGVS